MCGALKCHRCPTFCGYIWNVTLAEKVFAWRAGIGLSRLVGCRLVCLCARPFSPADCIHHLQIFPLMGKLCLPLLVFECICINYHIGMHIGASCLSIFLHQTFVCFFSACRWSGINWFLLPASSCTYSLLMFGIFIFWCVFLHVSCTANVKLVFI